MLAQLYKNKTQWSKNVTDQKKSGSVIVRKSMIWIHALKVQLYGIESVYFAKCMCNMFEFMNWVIEGIVRGIRLKYVVNYFIDILLGSPRQNIP